MLDISEATGMQTPTLHIRVSSSHYLSMIINDSYDSVDIRAQPRMTTGYVSLGAKLVQQARLVAGECTKQPLY